MKKDVQLCSQKTLLSEMSHEIIDILKGNPNRGIFLLTPGQRRRRQMTARSDEHIWCGHLYMSILMHMKTTYTTIIYLYMTLYNQKLCGIFSREIEIWLACGPTSHNTTNHMKYVEFWEMKYSQVVYAIHK